MKKHVLLCILSSCIALGAFAQLNYQWVKAVNSGSPGANTGKGITKDSQGNVYVTGTLARGGGGVNADFNLFGSTPKEVPNSFSGNCFFAKYSPDGNCEWAEALDLYATDALFPTALGIGIAVDNSNNIYLLGVFKDSVDLDVSSAEHKIVSKGLTDCFLAKYDSNLGFVWAKQIGGVSVDVASGLAIDNVGNELYITGSYLADTIRIFDYNGIDFSLANAGGRDIYMAKFLTDGTLQWAKPIGAEGDDLATAIDFNSSAGYIALTGSFQDTVDFNLGQSTPVIDTAVGGTDAFVAKFMPDGTCGWEKNIGHIGAANKSVGTAVKIDGINSKIYLAGTFSGATEFNLSNPGSDSVNAAGERDFFVAKYNISDAALEWRHPFGSAGGTDTATVTSIAIDNTGNNIYLAGNFEGAINFDPNVPSPTNSAGITDAFIAKYDASGAYVTKRVLGASLSDGIGGILFSDSEKIYVAGSFGDTVNFNEGVGIAKRGNAHGILGNALFVAHYSEGSSSISGTVTYGSSNTLLTNLDNKVQLYIQVPNDGNLAMQLAMETDIHPTLGTYTFQGVSAGTYYVLAVASDMYPNVAATYYGDSARWQYAVPVNILPGTNYTKNINLVESSTLNGSATLSGYVLEGGGFERIQGDPIPNRDIVLEGDPNNIIFANTETDQYGYYEFTDVPAGCYKIYVNIPGLPMDSTHHECPAVTDSIINLDFIADSSGISIPAITGIIQNLNKEQAQLTVYPNPHNGVLFIQLSLQKESLVKLELYNVIGDKVVNLDNVVAKSGQTKIQINAKEHRLGQGIYFLKITLDNKTVITKKIIQID